MATFPTVPVPCPACVVLRLTIDRAPLVNHLRVEHPDFVLCDRPYDHEDG